MKEQVTILLPVLNFPLKASELYALNSCQEILGDFPITFLGKEKIKNREELYSLCPGADFATFDDNYFTNQQTFTKLLLTPDFYQYFSWSRYILLLELNTLITKNELSYWCRQGYDHIQIAPESCGNLVGTAYQTWQLKFNPGKYLSENSEGFLKYVALAGSSLRKVDTFQKLTRGKKRRIHSFLTSIPQTLLSNDSLFWEYYLNRFRPEMTRPNTIGRNHFIQPYDSAGNTSKSSSVPFAFSGINEYAIPSLSQ